MKRVREIRTFHVAVVQQRLRNVQKKKPPCTCRVVILLSEPIAFFAVLSASYYCDPELSRTMVTLRHTSPLYRKRLLIFALI